MKIESIITFQMFATNNKSEKMCQVAIREEGFIIEEILEAGPGLTTNIERWNAKCLAESKRLHRYHKISSFFF